jgi:cyclic 2,3-diphosphoglycerate synthetase
MCEEPFGSPSHVSTLTSRIRDAYRSSMGNETRSEGINVVRTVFRPTPTRSVTDSDVFVATTAPEEAATSIRRHLETVHGCRVAGISHSLSDRDKLEDEISSIEGSASILLCEVKAAGVDVATRKAMDAGMDVVYMDNEPVGIEDEDFALEVDRIAELAKNRFGSGAGE